MEQLVLSVGSLDMNLNSDVRDTRGQLILAVDKSCMEKARIKLLRLWGVESDSIGEVEENVAAGGSPFSKVSEGLRVGTSSSLGGVDDQVVFSAGNNDALELPLAHQQAQGKGISNLRGRDPPEKAATFRMIPHWRPRYRQTNKD